MTLKTEVKDLVENMSRTFRENKLEVQIISRQTSKDFQKEDQVNFVLFCLNLLVIEILSTTIC